MLYYARRKNPPTLTIRPDEDEMQSQNALTCPKCGSTNVTTGARDGNGPLDLLAQVRL